MLGIFEKFLDPDGLNRKQSNVINAILSASFDVTLRSGKTVSQEQRNQFNRHIVEGNVTSHHFNRVLNKIRLPYSLKNSTEYISLTCTKINEDPYLKNIFLYITESDVTPLSLENLLLTYPNPLHLERKIYELLSWVKVNDPKNEKNYKLKMDRFLNLIYGKRMEYYVAIKRLTNQNSLAGIEKRDYSKSNNFLGSNVEVLGGPLPTSGKKLTHEKLMQLKLDPKYEFNSDGIHFYSSNPFEISQGRIAVILYIESEGKYIPRSYYLSNSQGVWRYLPNYKLSSNDKWYGKGYSEESLSAPHQIQKFLSNIAYKNKPLRFNSQDSELAFLGTCSDLNSKENSEYYRKINRTPTFLNSNFYTFSEDKSPPESVILNPAEKPNFRNLVSEWIGKNDTYGYINYEVYKSVNSMYL